jgi:hypothetical protein
LLGGFVYVAGIQIVPQDVITQNLFDSLSNDFVDVVAKQYGSELIKN